MSSRENCEINCMYYYVYWQDKFWDSTYSQYCGVHSEDSLIDKREIKRLLYLVSYLSIIKDCVLPL